jgi:membrane protease YdiL (CAAX protease family)
VNPLRPAIFALLFLAGLAVWLTGWLHLKQSRRAPVSGGPPALDRTDLLQLELTAKMLWGMEGFPQQPQQARQMEEQIRTLLKEKAQKKSDSAAVSRKIGILTAAFGEKKEALKRLEEAARLNQKTPQPDRQESQLWQRIYGGQRLTKDDLPRVRETLPTLSLDWYEHLVLEAAHRKLGDNTAADAEHRALAQKSSKTFLALMGITALLIGVGAIGLALNGFALYLRSQGKLKFGALNKTALPPYPLLETFALYFFLQNVPSQLFSERWKSLGLVVGLELLPLASLVWLGLQLRERGLNFSEIGLRWRGWWKDALWGVIAYLAVAPWILATLFVMALFMQRFHLPPPYHPIQDVVQSGKGAGVFVFLFLLAACFAPLLEEIFFRGTLHGALRRWQGPIVGIVFSAAFFAILHPQAATMPLFGLPIFLLGALFSCMYELRGSIIPNIVAHGINNAVVLAVFTMITR